MDDLPTSEELLAQDDKFDMLDSLVMDERDRKLIEHIAKVTDERSETSEKVGVLYGAFHMRSVMLYLMQKLKYRVAKAEWVKVFDL